MRVYDTNLTGASAAETGRAQELQKTERAGHGQSSRATSGSTDSVEFSGALGRLSQTLSNFHQDRASRVEALTAQYRNGTYRPDSRATSRAMIAHALDVETKSAELE